VTALADVDGVRRLIGPDEATEVGLSDGYRHGHPAEDLRRHLDENALR
jgi:hypothetical protein